MFISRRLLPWLRICALAYFVHLEAGCAFGGYTAIDLYTLQVPSGSLSLSNLPMAAAYGQVVGQELVGSFPIYEAVIFVPGGVVNLQPANGFQNSTAYSTDGQKAIFLEWLRIPPGMSTQLSGFPSPPP